MKAWVIASLAALSAMTLSLNANAQARFGVAGGFTSSKSDVKSFNTESVSKYHVGLTLHVPLPGWFSIQPSLLYQVKGTSLNKVLDDKDVSFDTSVGYLEVPLAVQWGPDLKIFRPYVFGEPFVGYGIHNKVTYDGTSDKISETNSWDDSNIDRWEYGLGLGVGVVLWKFQFSIKYYWNFASLNSGNNSASQIGSTVKDAFSDGRNFDGVSYTLALLF